MEVQLQTAFHFQSPAAWRWDDLLEAEPPPEWEATAAGQTSDCHWLVLNSVPTAVHLLYAHEYSYKGRSLHTYFISLCELMRFNVLFYAALRIEMIFPPLVCPFLGLQAPEQFSMETYEICMQKYIYLSQ